MERRHLFLDRMSQHYKDVFKSIYRFNAIPKKKYQQGFFFFSGAIYIDTKVFVEK